MTGDLALLRARVTAATQPSPDQALETDLLAALVETSDALTAAQLALATQSGDPAALAALQKQIDALAAQLVQVQGLLTAAQAAMSTEEADFAIQKAASDQAIAILTQENTTLKAAVGNLQQQINGLTTSNGALQTANASLAQQLAAAQQQITLLGQQAAKLQADLLTAQQRVAADQITIAARDQTIVDLNRQIQQLLQQLAALQPTNRAPVWTMVPTINFTLGVAQFIGIAQYVTDPDVGDVLDIAELGALPPGVTYDPVRKGFQYDGVGGLAQTAGVILMADDRRG